MNTFKSSYGLKKKIFGFTPNVFYTGVVSFLTDTSVKMVYSVMPMFLLSIGASKTSLSLIEGIAESTASLLKAFSGYWSDKIGKNKPIISTKHPMRQAIYANTVLSGGKVRTQAAAMRQNIPKKKPAICTSFSNTCSTSKMLLFIVHLCFTCAMPKR